MKVYHRTRAAASIVRNGFKDGEGSYMTSQDHRGVWISDEPLGANEGAFGELVFVVEIPEAVVAGFEWAEEGKGYREFLIPAEILNRYPIIEEISEPQGF